jgi:hypothetical protein
MPKKSPRVLFILKFRDADYGDYGEHSHDKSLSSGLFNSAKFVVDMLTNNRVEAKLVQVVDNNDIDREVFRCKPTHVVIEALWVVPSKFAVLTKRYPHIKWIVRVHSNVSFIGCEGIAIEWLKGYINYPQVSVAVNSLEALRELSWLGRVVYLPNSYPSDFQVTDRPISSRVVNVGCFGAIRPLKNQLIQAIAAIEFANSKNKKLRFHVNSTRQEQGGVNVMKNLRALFKGSRHELVEHGWMNHASFLRLVSKMDVGMQVSFTETFNIVAADMVSAGIPVVVSPEINWTSTYSQALPTDLDGIVNKLRSVTSRMGRAISTRMNRLGLSRYIRQSTSIWLKYLNA